LGKNVRKVKNREREEVRQGENRKQKRKAALAFLYFPNGIVYRWNY
jgi:hypothetical protein